MHIHVPRPLHGWREFAGEVGIIVIGVLIALGAEQLVEMIHWTEQVLSARTSLAEEIAHTNRAFVFRVAARDCVAARLAKLNDIVERAAKHDQMAPIANVIPDLGNALSTNVWEASKSAQTVIHFSRNLLRLYGSYYTQVTNVQAFMGQEVQDWGVIRVLQGDPGRLGPVDFAGLRVAIMHAQFENRIIAGIAEDELVTSRQLHVPVPTADPQRVAEVCRPL